MLFKQAFLSGVLAVLTLTSLLSVVITKYYERKYFVISENLATRKDNLYMRWESLQLERGALRAEGRVEHIARKKLDMHLPEQDEIVIVGDGKLVERWR